MNDYVVIPGDILRNDELTYGQKIILAKIMNLDNDKGCFATNKYFADLLATTINSVSKTINTLKKMGLINVEMKDNTRRSITIAKKDRGGSQKVEGGSPKRLGSPVTINIDSNIDYKTIQSISPEVIKEIQSKYPLLDVQDIYNDLVLYCESTGTKYKNYKATLQMWCSRAVKKLKESKPFVQLAKSDEAVVRQRKEYEKKVNQFKDEDIADMSDVGDIFKNFAKKKKAGV